MPILPRTSGARLKFCPAILAPSPWKGLGQGVLENWGVGKGLKSRESSLLSFSITPELHYSTTPWPRPGLHGRSSARGASKISHQRERIPGKSRQGRPLLQKTVELPIGTRLSGGEWQGYVLWAWILYIFSRDCWACYI